MHISQLTIENFRVFGDGDASLVLPLGPGLTALVGENESGKTAVIDALRLALGTSDQEWFRLEDSDFHGAAPGSNMKIICRFDGLTDLDKRTFVEFLTHGLKADEKPCLHLHWTAKDTGQLRRGRPYRRIEVKSGVDGSGPAIPPELRDLLRATYLRPLRDAEQAMSAGRGSRLSQVLFHSSQINGAGVAFDAEDPAAPEDLNVLGIGDYANDLLMKQKGVQDAKRAIDEHLKELALAGEDVATGIGVSGASASDEMRLRQLLEKLDLGLGGIGKRGLGSNNLLFIACEMLLLAQEEQGSRLLLIEEPEAHLDTQRQLQLVKAVQEQAIAQGVQVLMTTHSPNLASTIDLGNMVMIRGGHAYPLAEGYTKLEGSDYRFLERFLDATKANLFFARGVMIVEGDAENVLLPTLADLIGADFAKHGVSIVNVGGVGLRRYARIFQRHVEDGGTIKEMNIPVACMTDMDVVPECAEAITGKKMPTKAGLGVDGLAARRTALSEKADGQCVRTFVSDEWTFEYDLAFAGLAEDVYVAASLAKHDRALSAGDRDTLSTEAQLEFASIRSQSEKAVSEGISDGCTLDEMVSSKVYALFTTGTKSSKAMTAQYLAERLRMHQEARMLSHEELRMKLPSYVVAAIEYVTGGPTVKTEATDTAGVSDE